MQTLTFFWECRLMRTIAFTLVALTTSANCSAAPAEGSPSFVGDWVLSQGASAQGMTAVPSSERPAVISLGTDGYSGFDGCNYVNGRLESKGGSKLAFPGEGVSTLMACTSGGEQLSRHYQQALAATQSYRISGARLELLDEKSATLAVFVRQPVNIVGTSWLHASYHDGRNGFVGSLLSDRMSLRFQPSGQVEGFGGCQNYGGSFRVDEQTRKVSFAGLKIVASRKRCSVANRREQQLYLNALRRSVTYKRSGNEIEFYDSGGMRVVSLLTR